MKLVSIIIPTYNRAHLISETLDSVLAQTYTNWECIVVDDGSTDNTDEVLEAYVQKDARFKYFHRPDIHKPGGNGARNYGFLQSKGEYVNWFDSDDVMLPEKLETQVTLLHNTTFDYTICQTLMYDKVAQKALGLRCKRIVSESIFEDYITFKIFWLTQAPLWRRSFLEEYQLSFNESLKQSQDYDFHIKVLEVSQHYNYTHAPLVQVNVHDTNMSKSMVVDNEKLKSNLCVKDYLLTQSKVQISTNAKRTLYNHILEIYRQAVLSRSLKKVSIVMPYLIKHVSALQLSFAKQCKLLSVLFSGTVVYLLLGKGYQLLKINV